MDEAVKPVLPRESEVVQNATPLVSRARVVRAEVLDDLEAIDEEITELRGRAEQLVEQAEADAQSTREQARQEGRKEGLEECMENLAAARAEYREVRQRAEQDMVELAFEVARRIIGHAIDVKPEVIRDIVGEALMGARGREEITVRIHPRDHDQVQEVRNDYARELDGVPVYFEADSSLERGGCIIETESGRIDARLETQLQVLREALLGEGNQHTR